MKYIKITRTGQIKKVPDDYALEIGEEYYRVKQLRVVTKKDYKQIKKAEALKLKQEQEEKRNKTEKWYEKYSQHESEEDKNESDL